MLYTFTIQIVCAHITTYFNKNLQGIGATIVSSSQEEKNDDDDGIILTPSENDEEHTAEFGCGK